MKKTLLNCTAAATAIAVATSLSATTAYAQGEGELVDDSNVDVVISVGTRRGARSAADSPAPVDVIGGSELLNQGDMDLSNLLRTSVPSYNVNTQPISDAATLVRLPTFGASRQTQHWCSLMASAVIVRRLFPFLAAAFQTDRRALIFPLSRRSH